MNISKIDKYGLGPLIRSLKEEGKSNSEIARIIREQYGKTYPELKDFSRMAVARYFESEARKEVEAELKKGKTEDQLVEEIYQEFRTKMRSLIKKMEERDKLLDELIEQAKASGSKEDIIGYLREQRANIEQLRRNLVSLVQYAERQIKPVIQVSYKKEVNIRNLLLAFSKELCYECRRKVAKKILDMEE